MNNNIIDTLNALYPGLLPAIVEGIKCAYDEVNSIITSSRRNYDYWFEAAPHIRWASVQAAVHEKVDELGLKDIIAKSVVNKAENGHHLEIHTQVAILTIHCTDGAGMKPRDAVYRTELGIQTHMWDMLDIDIDERQSYFVITHQRQRNRMELADICISEMNGSSSNSISIFHEDETPVESINRTEQVEEKIEKSWEPVLK